MTSPGRSPDRAPILDAMFRAHPDGLLLVDARGRIVMANDFAHALLGYAPGELDGMAVEALVPPHTRAVHTQYRAAYHAAPGSRLMGTRPDLVAVRKDGTEVMVEIALSPLPEPELPYVIAAVRSVGEYPRVKRALRQASYSDCVATLGRIAVDARDPQVLIDELPRAAAAALEADIAMVFLLEPDGETLRIASGVGMIAEEQVGAHIAFNRNSSAGLALSLAAPLVIPDYLTETRFAPSALHLAAGLRSALAVPISDRGRIIGAMTVRTRTLRDFGHDEVRFLQSMATLLATSLQRAQSEQALGHAERLESVGQLTGGIAHDFNNLLTVIQGNLQVLKEIDLDSSAGDRAPMLEAAMRATRRAAELTGKLLAFSRRQVLQPVSMDLHQTFESMVELLRRTLDQRIVIECQIDAGCPRVRVDQALFESALLNLAINARDAMPDGGRIDLRAGAAGELPDRVRKDVAGFGSEPDRYVAIRLSDTGMGMPAHVRERAFEPFYTTKDTGRGTGLGLSTVYGFVTQSKGAVTIDSAPGAGTTVTLFLPVAEADGDRVGTDPDRQVQTAVDGLRVLLVENDHDVRQVAQRFLDDLGCTVTTAGSAEAVLDDAFVPGSVDVLVSDIALGAGMRGTELAQALQAVDPGLAIVLTSGYAHELIEADGAVPAEWELLPKPYSKPQLGDALARAAEWRTRRARP